MSSTSYLEIILDDKKKLYLLSRFEEYLEEEILIDLAVSFSAKNKSLKEGNVKAWLPNYISRLDKPGYLAIYEKEKVDFEIYNWTGTIDVSKNTLILPSWYLIKDDDEKLRNPQSPEDWIDKKNGDYDRSELRAALIILNQKTEIRFINDPTLDKDYQTKIKVNFKVQPRKDDLYLLQDRLFRFDGLGFQELQYNQR